MINLDSFIPEKFWTAVGAWVQPEVHHVRGGAVDKGSSANVATQAFGNHRAFSLGGGRFFGAPGRF